MSFTEGLLGGLAAAKNDVNDRREREREFSIMEAMAADRRSERATDAVYRASNPGAGPVPTEYTYDGKIAERPAFAFNYFREKGVPDHVAAGLVGNLMQESGADINPAAVGDNGNAFGSGQWNGPRMRAYKAFAAERGVDPTDFQTQLDWLWQEGQTTESGAWKKIMGASSPEEAALIASKHFWRPGTPHNERRVAYATSVFDNRSANPAAAPAKAAAEGPKQWRWFENYRTSQNGAQ